jgi:hypothetical protein
MTNSWRALARMARDRIVSTDPEEIGLILSVSAAGLLLTNIFLLVYSFGPSALPRLPVYGFSTKPPPNVRTCLACSTPFPRRDATTFSRSSFLSSLRCSALACNTGPAIIWDTLTRLWRCWPDASARHARPGERLVWASLGASRRAWKRSRCGRREAPECA